MRYRRLKTVELYARVRRAVLVDGKSRRAVAREFGLLGVLLLTSTRSTQP